MTYIIYFVRGTFVELCNTIFIPNDGLKSPNPNFLYNPTPGGSAVNVTKDPSSALVLRYQCFHYSLT